jgi:hypothetical protein
MFLFDPRSGADFLDRKRWVVSKMRVELTSTTPGKFGDRHLIRCLQSKVCPTKNQPFPRILNISSGRLPYTIGKSITDYPAQVIYTSSTPILSIPYSEGIFIDYRHFDAAGIAPRFEFGFGLSFTTFAYSGLSIRGSPRGGQAPTGPGSSVDPWCAPSAKSCSLDSHDFTGYTIRL